MIIRRLKLTNFRSYKSLSASFESGVNLLYGGNAVGKTNVLEAIYFITHLTGFRSEREADLVKRGEEAFQIEAEFVHDSGACLNASLVFQKNQKFLRANGVPILRASDWYGKVPSYLFSPESMKLLWSNPASRRALWDSEIAKLDEDFRSALIEYKTAWKARNKVLKQLSMGENSELNSLFNFYTDSILVSGSKIISARLRHLKDVLTLLPEIYRALTKESLRLRVRYSTSLKQIGKDADFQEVHSAFSQALKSVRQAEISRGFTLLGPQRDDIKFYLNEIPMGQVASQGQVRSATIALILSLAQLYKDKARESPLILLDDALSELDDERKKNLVNLLSHYPQSFLTSASKREIMSLVAFEPKIFHVKDGTINRIKVSLGTNQPSQEVRGNKL